MTNIHFNSTTEYCNHYFKNPDKEVWLKIKEKRYKQIRGNNFYLNTDTEIFKNEVLKFWAGRDNNKGWNFRNSQFRKTSSKEWLPFQDENGEVADGERIIKELDNDNLELHGNYSWSMMHMGGDVAADMKKLKNTLGYLFNESIDISKRFFGVVDENGSYKIEGMGQGKASALLHIKYPEKYGVWNSCTDVAFKILSKVNLRFKIREGNVGKKYEKINELLKWLVEEYRKDQYKNGFKSLSDVDIFIWYVANRL